MTHHIRSYNGRTVELDASTWRGQVAVRFRDEDRELTAERFLTLERLLEALAAETGVIIIDPATLPEVTRHGGQLHAGEGGSRARFMHGDAASYRQYALNALAIAEFLDTVAPLPPEDTDRQVDGFKNIVNKALQDRWDRGHTPTQIAEDLVKVGARLDFNS